MIQLKLWRTCVKGVRTKNGRRSGIWRKKVFTVLLMIMVVCMMSSCGQKEKRNADIDTDMVNNKPDSRTKNEENKLYVDFINVGKGDCAIIRINNHTYMIDTGYEDTAPDVISFLQDKGIIIIDGLIITHFDKDHVGGASQIISRFDIKKIFMPDYEGEGNKYKKFIKYLNKRNLNNIVTRVTEDINIDADGVKIDIYAPHMESYAEENDYSLVTKIIYKEDSFLFAGDAEETRIEELLDSPMLGSDVLKIPYHGILGKNNIQFIDEVNPKYSIITSDTEEDVSASIVYELENIGSEYYFNCNGNVSCISDGMGNISVHQDND